MRRTSEIQLVMESQQVEEPGWAGPEQVTRGTPLGHYRKFDRIKEIVVLSKGKRGNISRFLVSLAPS